MTSAAAVRMVQKVIPALATLEGEGVAIRRAFPTREFDQLDPFLLLDEMGPIEIQPGAAPGFPDHPHRGFETVTYLLEGQMEHRDSSGNRGVLNPGDVQWMTAGAGLVHSEMPGPELLRGGGRLHGFQLWVNLPRRDKMAQPRYQEMPAVRIPAAQAAGGAVQVKVIAGEALGVRAAIGTHTPILYLHFTLAPGAAHVQEVPREYNAFAYVIEGAAGFGGDAPQAPGGSLVTFARNGDAVELRNTGNAVLDLLLVAGVPLGEPVARYGPFVMNTREELHQAVEDFRSGRMGTIRH